MDREEIEKDFLTKYGCNCLYEFIDVCLDFSTAIYIMNDYFDLLYELNKIDNKK